MKVFAKLASGFLRLVHRRTERAVEYAASNPLAPPWKRRLALMGMVLLVIVEVALMIFSGIWVLRGLPELLWLTIILFGLAIARVVILVFDLRDVLRATR